MNYEQMLEYANNKDIEIINMDFKGNLKGLYADSLIALDSNLETESEKRCILAEELGHYHHSSGIILDQKLQPSTKQEIQARGWAYKHLVPFKEIIKAYKEAYVCNYHELAEFLDITEEFLLSAMEYYKAKYGLYHPVGKYVIRFEPLDIMTTEEFSSIIN